uniref:NFAM1 Ig-like domain-containing protein n=1 Tax=Coturnix japonica TaxID=93934 RepID=A0A8C2Y9R3_COTJA
ISCLSVHWRFAEELTREKGKPMIATGYLKSHSNYLRDVADHKGHMLCITQFLTRAISIPCEVVFPYTPKYTRFTIFYYWINALDQEVSIYSKKQEVDIPPGKENMTAIISYDYETKPLESISSTGTYYCKVQWDDIQIKGKGVFVLVRGK